MPAAIEERHATGPVDLPAIAASPAGAARTVRPLATGPRTTRGQRPAWPSTAAAATARCQDWWQPPLANGQSASPGLVALPHARLAFAGLPPGERADWQALMQHYVFADEDPSAHIPAARRGVLGALDSETLAALKQRIFRSL